MEPDLALHGVMKRPDAALFVEYDGHLAILSWSVWMLLAAGSAFCFGWLPFGWTFYLEQLEPCFCGNVCLPFNGDQLSDWCRGHSHQAKPQAYQGQPTQGVLWVVDSSCQLRPTFAGTAGSLMFCVSWCSLMVRWLLLVGFIILRIQGVSK